MARSGNSSPYHVEDSRQSWETNPGEVRQRSPSKDAPEVDPSQYQPQLYLLPDGLQHSAGDPPEIVPNTEPPYLREVESTTTRKDVLRKWFFVGAICSILAIAIGLGTGLSLRSRDQSSLNASSTSTSASSPTSTAPSSSTAPFINGALRDISLATVITNDSNRHVFFQDINGTLRHSVLLNSKNTWLPSDFVITQSQPRNNTPLCVTDGTNYTYGAEGKIILNLFFVDIENFLAAVQYSSSANVTVPKTFLNSSFPVSTSSRSLSIYRVPSNISTSFSTNASAFLYNQVVLTYESPDSVVTFLQGLYLVTNFNKRDAGDTEWIWQNVTGQFYPQSSNLSPGSWISAPFSPIVDSGSHSTMLFFDPQSLSNKSAGTITALDIVNVSSTSRQSLNPKYSSSFLSSGANQVLPNLFLASSTLSRSQTDLINLVGSPCAVINQTYYSSFGSPQSPFPFARLAYSSSLGQGYLYHQINESVLLEELIDISFNSDSYEWGNATVIKVPTS